MTERNHHETRLGLGLAGSYGIGQGGQGVCVFWLVAWQPISDQDNGEEGKTRGKCIIISATERS